MDPEARKVIELGYGGSERLTMNMGPQHPSAHGVFRAILTLEGETVVGVDAVIGYLHRCHEKLGESLTYTQYPSIASKTDYVAAMTSELAYVRAAEMVGKVEVPRRAQYLRVIMAELQRIASHCVAVGTYGMDIGAFTPFLHLLRDREKILDMFEWTCGARLLYNYNWVGGLSHDVPEGFIKACRQFLREFEAITYPELIDLLLKNKIFIKRTANIGVCPVEVAISYDLTGPNLRGSGPPRDLRKDAPYSGYENYEFQVCVGKGEFGPIGSCFDRNWVRTVEMAESAKIVHQALDRLEKMERGVVHEKVPNRVKPPKSEIYSRSGAPRGQLGY